VSSRLFSPKRTPLQAAAIIAVGIGLGVAVLTGWLVSSDPTSKASSHATVSGLANAPQTSQRTAKLRINPSITPGHIEEVRISQLVPRMAFEINVIPETGVNGCYIDGWFCGSRLYPAPGSATFLASRKGRALVHTQIPSGYTKVHEPDGASPQHFEFENGERVLIGCSGLARGAHRQVIMVRGATAATVTAETPVPSS
jgi:hypothetical protein